MNRARFARGSSGFARVSSGLPDFPWDKLAPAAERARAHPDGIVDLSVGTPVDPTPESVRRALANAADSPGYPLTVGRVDTRQAAIDYMQRRNGVTGLGLDAVIPSIGSK
jgi:aspartate/methionine/tyrosine aminotransferase